MVAVCPSGFRAKEDSLLILVLPIQYPRSPRSIPMHCNLVLFLWAAFELHSDLPPSAHLIPHTPLFNFTPTCAPQVMVMVTVALLPASSSRGQQGLHHGVPLMQVLPSSQFLSACQQQQQQQLEEGEDRSTMVVQVCGIQLGCLGRGALCACACCGRGGVCV